MSDNRLVKLGNLLESKNRTIRNEAAAVIGQIPFTNVHLLPMLRKFLQNTQWDTRVSTAEALGKVLSSMNSSNNLYKITESSGEKLESLDIQQAINHYRPLLCSEGEEMNAKGVKVSKQEQRTIIDKHLNMESRIYGSNAFLQDSEIDPSLYQPSTDVSLEKIELKSEISLSELDEQEEIEHSFRQLLGWITEDISDQKWQTRHGGFLALHKILSHSFSRLTSRWIEVISQRVIEVLALDRFVDFATGSNSVAPVRETAAQSLCVLICKIPGDSRLLKSIINHLRTLLLIEGDKCWQCRQTSLIVLKYYFAAMEPDSLFFELIHDVLERMNDQNDEVISAAIVALASLFSNQNLSPEKRRELVNLVMESVWKKLKQPECLKQLRDGVDSVLTDLIGIVDFYVQVEPESNLDDSEFRIFVDLLDPRLTTRTMRVLECLGVSLSKPINLSDETLFQLLKMLYRCCILTPPSEGAELLDYALIVLLKLVEVFSGRFGSLESLHNSIGYWIGCLLSDDKKAEIDVFSLCVDGPTSSTLNPTELMCGAEISSIQENERPKIILERKIVLARFLSPIVDALYRSGMVIRDQPVHMSIQLIFIPYLRSTVLSQRLGISLMLNCWARMFRRQAARQDLQNPLIFPELVIIEAMNALNSPPEVFNDVLNSVQNLTQECNEFMRYCKRNGAKEEDMPDGSLANELETYTKTAFDACMKYCKQQNFGLVKQRFDYITHLIKLTKATIRINANRVNSLLGSALFYFNHSPPRLTPMIRPLMESAENEDQIKMAEETLFDSVPLMLIVSANRDPCPHAKVVRQLCSGLLASESYCPSIKKWEDEKECITVISMVNMENDENISRAKNSELVLNACFAHLGPEFLNICKEIKKYLNFEIDEKDLETTLLNFEVIRSVFFKWRILPNFEQANSITNLLKNNNPAIRFRISRLILEFAKVDLFETMNLFYNNLKKFINNIENDCERAGAVELLFLFSTLEEKLVGATSLLAPLAFSAISDRMESIRETSASAFRKMITILPLEKEESKSILQFKDDILETYKQNLNFLNVLSSPGSLPHLKKSEIPGLNPEVDLRGYQLEGITWMMFLHKFNLNGILADDMGLGKTLQTLCLLALVHLGGEKEKTFSLIVCPKTLCNHWCNEWRKYFAKEKPLRRIDELDKSEKSAAHIVVASYEELRHHSVLRFLMPGYLSTRSSFHQKYIKPMLACRNPKATDQQTREGEEALCLLHRQILPFLLRRLKSDVLSELPEKVVQDCLCQLTEIQKIVYSAVVDKCTLMREKKKEVDGSFSLSALHTLISLRKLVDHPILIQDILEKLDLKDGFDLKKKQNQSYELSGKLVALKEILEECQIGKEKTNESVDSSSESGVEVPSICSHRALIFCQWRASVDLLAHYLDNGELGAGISYLRLDGTVPPGDRQAVVDQFNQDESIDLMLLTTHIGGVGLNLTGADVVIFLDHDWNPVKDLQAIDRAHRLGQKKTVNVYRLITQGSIEEKIMRYQKFKSDTANVLVGSDNRSLGSMATDELLELFALDDGDSKSSNAGTSKNFDTVISRNSDEGPKTKKRKVVSQNIPGSGLEKWSVEELWDNSQYEEQHSISQFLKKSNL
ncbi:hypothetical protein FO519_007361 [Halicephalobus sp. NKZ332]|nr:hypothetical protein FO519_007361 [Halicephalobus sp. NKZ332]